MDAPILLLFLLLGSSCGSKYETAGVMLSREYSGNLLLPGGPTAFTKLGEVQRLEGPAAAAPPPAGFLVSLSPHKSCLSSQRRQLVLVPCDLGDPAQRWAWLAGARLVHAQSSRCLWADPSPRLPGHAHPAKLSGCREAPAWSCLDTDRGFGLADTHLYLRKHATGLVVGRNLPPSEWRRYDLDPGGRERMTSLCTDAGSDAPVGLSGSAPSARTPAVSDLLDTVRVLRHVAASVAAVSDGASTAVTDIRRTRTRRSETTASATDPPVLNGSDEPLSPDMITTDQTTDQSGLNGSDEPLSPDMITTDQTTDQSGLNGSDEPLSPDTITTDQTTDQSGLNGSDEPLSPDTITTDQTTDQSGLNGSEATSLSSDTITTDQTTDHQG
ncbi:uncharacterized protein LOC130536101 [Takifugu flavidus]|uniref:uncharacterized protein LOC130536101 n=1 Tax=Takifugu flavidus TaxID=433684 RepID=UPI00254412FD|nr:uncharacterized protein LOC130536101 [Takifugu flavidus]